MNKDIISIAYMNLYKGILQNTDFSFDDQFYFYTKVIEDRKEKKYVLHIEKKENIKAPEGFWGKNITSLNMIIGKNGSGKTSAFNCILNNIVGGITSLNGEGILYVTKINNNYFVHSNFRLLEINTHGNDIQIENGIPYSRKKLKSTFFSKVIYYSSYVGSTRMIRNSDSIINLSKDYQIQKIYEEKSKSQVECTIQDILNSNKNKLMLECINDSNIKNISFLKIPNIMRIYNYSNNIESVVEQFPNEFVIGENRVELYNDANGFIEDESKLYYEEAISEFLISVLWIWKKNNKIEDKEFNDFIKGIGESNNISVADLLYKDISEKNKYKLSINERQFWINFINYLREEKNQFILYYQTKDEFYIKINKNTKFIEEILNSMTGYCNCSFENSADNENGIYSSGNQDKLLMWASMFKAYKDLKNNGDENNNILLLFDEVDAFYHPEYKINVINELIKMIETIFKDYNVQVLIATHTPLEVSDMASDNITYLQEGQKNNSLNENKTFGANISSLLKNSFFLNQTMGQFAKEKINRIIKMINDEIPIDNKEVKYVLSILGDSLLKNKLEDMYYEKYPDDKKCDSLQDKYIDEIEELKNRIMILKAENKELKER